jgi:asparagine synthase (glutamine-hydrolysing)
MSNVDLGDLSSIFPNLTENPGILSEAGAVCGDLVQSALALDFRTYLPGSVLTKVDRAAMANSLEVRPPLLDNELIDFAFGVSSSLKMRGGVGKALLKRAAESLLPADILHRRKKGFGIPLAAWLSGPLHPRMKWILEDSPLWGRQNADSILSRSRFVQWETEHRERRVDRSKPLWALLVLDHWARRLGVTLR